MSSSTPGLWDCSPIPAAKPKAVQCEQWARTLTVAGVRLVIPEISDYEVRRKLIHIGAMAGLGRLDRLKGPIEFVPIYSGCDALGGRALGATRGPEGCLTAPSDVLDGDVILMRCSALPTITPGDVLTVATGNVGHLAQFVDAQPWQTITG